jgi:predicted ABC-type ATPase
VSRYSATLSNLFAAIQQADRAYLFDNSGKRLNLIAEVFNGGLQIKQSNLPQWFMDYVVVHYV